MLVPLEKPSRDIHFANCGIRFDITPADGKAWDARVLKLKNDLAKCIQIVDDTKSAAWKCEEIGAAALRNIEDKLDGQTAWLQFKKTVQGKPLPKANPFLITVSTEAEKVANLMYKEKNGSLPIHGIDSGRTRVDWSPKLYEYLQLASEELRKAYNASNFSWDDIFSGVRNGHFPSGKLNEYSQVLKNILRKFQ